jgi:hypothetical protein
MKFNLYCKILFFITLFIFLNYIVEKKENFSIIFYADKPKKIYIPKNYPKYQRGPCLRKNKNGSVSWGVLTDNNPGICYYKTKK